eukprot:Phypoly_transcript_08969.p1 GENE.Phypoly_transcript_08969~~Phypoly_transcript_08969.p1  ORF type:complete len:432 (+),score=71.48 Phypoly_transcript_08969:109-1404(+)
MARVLLALCFLALLSLAFAGCGTYTVVSGDTLNGIAAKYGNKFTGQDICTLNNLPSCDDIEIGQVLQLPCTSGSCGTYTVVSGDTLNGIAAKYGNVFTGAQLCAANNLPNCDDIEIGQVLTIPSCSSGSTSGSTSSSGSTSTSGSGSTTGAPSGGWPNGPLKAMYNIDGGYQSDLQQMADAGYNLILLAFHVSGQPKYASSVWKGLGATTQQNVANYIHNKGGRIVVSAGGAEDVPYGSFSGTQYGTSVANFAKSNHLDGVDFDLENFGGNFATSGMSTAQTVQWVTDATNAARNILGPNAIITHAPQTPYFGANHGFGDGYTKIYQKASSINFFLVQFYNNDNGLTTYNSIFNSDNGGSVTEIANGGVPLNKIVVGKPVNSNDGSGYVAPGTLHTYFTQAKSQYGWNGGVMGWVWHDQTTNTNWIKAIYP